MASIRADMLNDKWISTAPYKVFVSNSSSLYEIIVSQMIADTNEYGDILHYKITRGKQNAIRHHERIIKIFSYLDNRKRRNIK